MRNIHPNWPLIWIIVADLATLIVIGIGIAILIQCCIGCIGANY